jgi:RecB family exonuclease
MGTVESKIVKSLRGLKPQAILILPEGFVREEWKSLCFQNGISLSAAAIQSPLDLASQVVPELKGRVLDAGARVELLRVTFKAPGLREALSTLLEHRYRPRFFESLDRTLQKGRAQFVHAEEAQIFRERLDEKRGESTLRSEFFELNRLWEAVLRARDLWDESRIFEVATERLRDEGFLFPVRTFYLLEHFEPKPRVRSFLEALRGAHEVNLHRPGRIETAVEPRSLEHILAHSLEDGAQHLMDEVIRSGNPDLHPLVIEDRPEIRRTLSRIAAERGVPLQDLRDPSGLAQSEELKTALLELEMASRNFEGETVLAWWTVLHPHDSATRKALIERGSLRGIEAYAFLPALSQTLAKVRERYPSRMSLVALQGALLQSAAAQRLPAWVGNLLERLMQGWVDSLTLIGLEEGRRPIRIWHKELSERLRQAPPTVPRFKHEAGLRIYRVDQAVSLSLLPGAKVHFFGVSTSFFEPDEEGTEWFSARDLEVLAGEFGLASRRERVASARASFLAWARASGPDPVFHEFLHDGAGMELESLELVLSRIEGIRKSPAVTIPVHPRILPSLNSTLKAPPVEVGLPVDRTEFPISFLNSMGDCPFTAYARYLLELRDERDPDFDLSGDAHGNLLHHAIELLVTSEGSLTARDAFDQAFVRTAKPAWIRSERLFVALRRKTVAMLESFLESEREYRERSATTVFSQEEDIRLTRGGISFQGRMDRVDTHADGLVLMDYKTGSSLPNATQTLSSGKGLQLPAYALALREAHGREVISAQYVQITPRKTNRNLGFLFERWNKSKKADPVPFPVSTARSVSGSLVRAEPSEIWAEMDRKVMALIERLKSGDFSARPADPEDCKRCRYSGVCGRDRAVLA